MGYGVVAPEYGWDDYKGLDVRGKTLIMLVNDPAVPDPNDPSKLDPAAFRGPAMTYYGRWTYKYEIASEKGAAAAILVHETGPAGYPFEVVKGSWSRENFDIAQPAGSQAPARVAVEGWISLEKANELFQACGRDFQALKQAAAKRDFRPVPLGCNGKFSITNALREVKSRNVVARLEGSDPALKNETVIYTAHWDHLGRDPALAGDQIFNGAADNASGVAAVLEIARAFTRVSSASQAIDPLPGRHGRRERTARRQVLRLASALSAGTNAGRHQPRCDQPLGPDQGLDLDRHGELDARRHARRDRQASTAARSAPTPTPRRAITSGPTTSSSPSRACRLSTPRGGREYIGKSADFGQKKLDEYTANDYHKVSDQVKPDWDLSGAAEDAKLLVELGYRVAQADRFPEWKPASEFRAKREAMLKATKP